MTLREALSDPVLAARLSAIADEARTDWVRALGKNDFLHSQNIETILNRLIPDSCKRDPNCFTQGELFLLLVSVYLHDIGRAVTDAHHELESYKLILAAPETYRLKSAFEAQAVAQICAAHGPEADWPLEKCDPSFGLMELSPSRTMNLRRLGALLRIADELENTYLRVRGVPRQEQSLRQLISDIEPIPSKLVVQLHVHPRTTADWASLESIRSYTESRIRHAGSYLRDIQLDYYQVWLKPPGDVGDLKLAGPSLKAEDLTQAIAGLLEPRHPLVSVLHSFGSITVSIYCEYIAIGLRRRLGVFVADSSDVGSIREMCSALRYLINGRLLDDGLLVVSQELDATSRVIVDSQGVGCRIFSDIVAEESGFKPAIQNVVSRYAGTEVARDGLFVEPYITDESGILDTKGVTWIKEWVNKPGEVQITLLGDFGAGKSTLCKRVVAELAADWLEAPAKSRIPLYIPLNKLTAGGTVESLLTDSLVNDLGVNINYATFEVLNRSGAFVVVLDGFDEISGLIDEASVLSTFRQLDRLVAARAKIIVSCRTHFFKDNKQIHSVHAGSALYGAVDSKAGYQLIYVKPFNVKQIKQYLELRARDKAAEYWAVIDKTYNLYDLAQRPVLLNVIAKTVPQVLALGEKRWSVASLYALYVAAWLTRDDWRSQFSGDERRRLAIYVAEHLFVKGTTKIHYSGLGELLRQSEWHGTTDSKLLDYELRTCNFLKASPDGWYGFAHQSFMEYFLAEKFTECVMRGQMAGLKWSLPTERGAGGSAAKQASKETEAFVFQLVADRLQDANDEELGRLLWKNERARGVVDAVVRENDIRTMGRFYAIVAFGSMQREWVRKCAKMMWAADNRDEAVRTAVNMIRELKSVEEIVLVGNAIVSAAPPGVSAVDRLVQTIERRESELERSVTGVSVASDDEDSFSRRRRDEQRDKARRAAEKAGTEWDAEEFYRKWYRDKQEAEQKAAAEARRQEKNEAREKAAKPKKPRRKK